MPAATPVRKFKPDPVKPCQECMALYATAMLFAAWGLAQWMFNVLFPNFAQHFALGAAESRWIQALFNIAYGLLAIPAVLTHRFFGYKTGVLFALSGVSLGPFLLYLAITQHQAGYFLAATAVLGAGWAWFETSVNPLIVEMGPPATAVRRLNLAQAFYPLGLIAGSYGALWLLQSHYQLAAGALVTELARPYVFIGIGVLALSFVIDKIAFPPIAIARAGKNADIGKEFAALLKRSDVRLGLVAIACNIIAQSCTWGGTFSYVLQEIRGAGPEQAGAAIRWSIILLCAGRFAWTVAMKWIAPERILAVCAAISLLLVLMAAAVGGPAGFYSLVAASLFMAPIYATVFAATILGLGPLTKLAAGFLVTAAGIAATLNALFMGDLLDLIGPRAVVGLAAPCLAVVLWFAWQRRCRAGH